MPRGAARAPKKNYKGRARHFTDEETLKEQLEKEAREKQWRQQRGEVDDEESDEKKAEGGIEEEESESSDESSDEESDKHKGVQHLIEIENPNRAQKRNLKMNALDTGSMANKAPQLSRREKEELEKQQAKEHYQKLHQEGKTEEARNDMARLALIRKQREDAAKQREQERLAKEAAAKKT